MSLERKWRHMKSRLSREIPKASKTIATESNSHTPTSNNSQASAEAIVELTAGLDFVFEDPGSEVDHDHGDINDSHLERLLDQAGKYCNSKVDDDAGEEWSCPLDASNLIYAACCCSSDVYETVHTHTSQFEQVMVGKPSLLGTKKAIAIWKSPKDRALIVAVRGTASKVDHMVNLSHTAGNSPSLMSFKNEGPTVRVHSGYLTCATALIPDLEKEISRLREADDSIQNVVFTGHSAGGAVASLLFVHFANQPGTFQSFKLSLVTFGSPPVTADDITPLVKKLPQVGMVLSFVNELDMVTRADNAYIHSVLNLYRARFNLPPVARVASQVSTEPAPAPGIDVEWPLPPPSFYPVGDILLLRKNFPTLAPHLTGLFKEPPGCVKLSSSEFGRLLFCDISVHKRKHYVERVKRLVEASRTNPQV
ncbi:hypothetical protein AUP68_16698 [Ilyonectria robusta]